MIFPLSFIVLSDTGDKIIFNDLIIKQFLIRCEYKYGSFLFGIYSHKMGIGERLEKFKLILLVLFLIVYSYAQETNDLTKEFESSIISVDIDNENKDALTNNGLQFGFSNAGDLFSNLQGGVSKGTNYINIFSFSADLNLHDYFDINETVIHASAISVNGKMPNDLVGSLQGISNIETESILKLYDIWIDYKVNKQISILTGLFDVNSEFDTKYNSMLFINPSHGIGAEFGLTGINGPSIFPNTSFGIRFNYTFGHDNYIKLGALDAIPGTEDNPYKTQFDFQFSDGFLLVSEFGYDCYSDFEIDSESSLCINYAVGAWYFTNQYEDQYSGNAVKGNFGFYSFLESRLLHFNKNSFVSAFFRIGTADPDVNQIALYYSGGFVISNLFFDEDQIGLAFASTRNSRKNYLSQLALSEEIKNSETNFELTYLVKLTDYFSLQPDLQYFINPSACSEFQNSFCVGLRTLLEF